MPLGTSKSFLAWSHSASSGVGRESGAGEGEVTEEEWVAHSPTNQGRWFSSVYLSFSVSKVIAWVASGHEGGSKHFDP